MVVLYMARNYKCNSPAGRGDAGARFYNRVFRVMCTLQVGILPGTLPRPAFKRLPAVPLTIYFYRLCDHPFDRTLVRRFEHPST